MADASPSPLRDLAAVRAAEFPGVLDAIYLNAASVTPLSERGRKASEAFTRRRSMIRTLDDEVFGATLARARGAAARLIGATAEEIALGGNTSFGINLAAQSLPLPRGSVILVPDREFPANVYPWMAGHGGTRLELLPSTPDGLPDEEGLLHRIGRGDVSVLALSAVQFTSGYRADLARIGAACRRNGVFFVVDAIQALGQLPVDVREMNIDVLATGGHKWLCAPFGTGFAYVRRELLARMEPRVIGWNAMRASGDLTALLQYRYAFVEDARKFEVATPPFQEIAGLAGSIELLLEVGIPAVELHVRALVDPLVEWIRRRPGFRLESPLDSARRSGIVSFLVEDPDPLHAALRAAGITLSLREGALRVAPHLYNTAAEMERLMDILSGAEGR